MSLDCYDVDVVLLSWHDADVSVERVGYGLKGVEAEVVFAEFHPCDVWPHDVCAVGYVLLCHASFLPQRGNVVAYALPFLFFFYHLDVVVFAEVTW